MRGIRTLLLLSLLATTPSAVSAAERISGPNAVVPEDRSIDDDLHIAGNNVSVHGPVRGDVLAAGRQVTVSARVDGDVIAAGANVTVSGPVGDDLRAAGASVVVSGMVEDNAALGGSNVVIKPEGSIGRDADVNGASIDVQGTIGRDLHASGYTVRVSSEVGRNLVVYADRVILAPGATVAGDLVAYTSQPPQIGAGARVMGETRYVHQGSKGGPVQWVLGWLFLFACLFVTGAVMLALARASFDRVAELAGARPFRSLFTGLLSFFLIPVLIALLGFTMLGIPLALVLLAGFVAILVLAVVHVAYCTGSWLMHRLGRAESSPYARMAVGAIVLAVLLTLPWVGLLVGLVAMLLGTGAAVLRTFQLIGELRRPSPA
jgi:hypothetical protein